MGPNSRGGQRNKDNNNPSGCTRNRFSKWKPPTKNQKDKFEKQHENRILEQHRNENAPEHPAPGKGGISVMKQPDSVRAPATTGELLVLNPAVVAQLLTVFDPVPVLGPESNSTEQKESRLVRGKIVVYDQEVPPMEQLVHNLSDTKKLKVISGGPGAAIESPQRSKVRILLNDYGFAEDNISSFLDKNASMIGTLNDLDVFLAMLMHTNDESLPTTNAPLKSSYDPIDITSNEELLTELDILSSIYMENIVYRTATVLGKEACVVDISVPLEDELLHSVNLTNAGVVGPQFVQLRLIISDVSTYPALSSPLYGWIMPSGETTNSTDAAQSTTQLLPMTAARELSISAMKHIRGYQMQNEAPAAFEFIQHVRDALPAALQAPVATLPEPPTDTAPAGGVSSLPKGSVGGKAELKKGAVVELPAADEGPPPLPPKPMTSFMQCSEYRTALSAAFSAGLVGQAAREKARADLEYVLPKSTLEALKLEEAYHEEVMNRTCSLEALSTRTIIDATRLLTDELQINKAKAKALITLAKEALVAKRDYFARSEDLMRNKIVACAVDIFRERLRRKEAKKQQSTRRKAPGLTLRDAFARRRAKEQAALATPEEPVAPPPPAEVASRNRNMFQKATPGAAAAQADEEEDWEEEEEEMEEEPLDPAQVQAAQEAAAEKKRLQDLESVQLQRKFKEKQRLPKYRERQQQRASLPAYQMKAAIVQAIEEHTITVISGDTGCGKTTQVPQFVLDDWVERGRGGECNIIVTQPRRISAMSVAERIAYERVEQVGQSAGYHIRLETKKGPGTRLLLMTTGVLLRMLQMEGNLDGISHVFVDEVHERDLNTDFLLIILKKLLAYRPDLKIVLMSATLNANLFLNYFRGGGVGPGKHGGGAQTGIPSCTLISIPGRTFPVTSYYLEDAFQVTNFEFAPTSPCLASAKGKDKVRKGPSAAEMAEEKRLRRQFLEGLRQGKKYREKVIGNLEIVDEAVVNADLIVKLVLHIMATDTSGNDTAKAGSAVEDGNAASAGAILIFVPGLSNIQDVIDALKGSPLLNHKSANVRIMPLHSSLSSAEQNAVFQKMPPGCRKIVVSTNIAETSVTIEDVVYVIDTCRVKENSYDEGSRMNELEEMWTSKANCRQRRGRAGRVRSGVCYHLVSRFTMDRLPEYMTPEMLKMSLEDTILQILALDMGNPYHFLRSAISPPDDVAITNGVLFLESLSAVVVNNVDVSQCEPGQDLGVDLDCEITPLGYHLAALPINPRIGKLILYGVLLKCVDPILTIASTESVKSVFNSPFGAKELADEAKLRFLEGNSDLLTSANAFAVWKTEYGSGGGSGGGRKGGADKPSEGEFCRVNFLSMNSMRLVDQMRQQFLSLLKDIGFMPTDVTLGNVERCAQNAYGRNIGMIKCAMCAGLSPNILQAPDLSGKNAGKRLAEVSLQSRSQGVMKVHPSSVMSEAKALDSPYIVFLEAMRTSQVYVRDVTTVPALILAMFSGRSKVNLYNGAVVVDAWLRFRTENLRAASVIAKVRDAMEDAFMQKVLEPSSETSPQWNGVLSCIEKVVPAI